MANTMRRSFAVTFFADSDDPELAARLDDLDRVVAGLRSLADAGKCRFQDTLTEEMEQVQTFSYHTVFGYFKGRGGMSNNTKPSVNVMQTLFDMRTPTGERVVRFYCREYHHQPGVCTCPEVSRLTQRPPRRIHYRMLAYVAVAQWWLVDRADVLAITDEQLTALDIHPGTRRHVTDFVHWLRANPDAH